MSSDDYQVQNIYRYSRKSYKKGLRDPESEVDSPRAVHASDFGNLSPRSDGNESPLNGLIGCCCALDSEGGIANILHKKLPVITLAQQQIQRLLDETDKLLCDNSKCCRQSKCRFIIITLIVVAFLGGLLVGAATCGSYLGRFNSPILTCIDNFFIPKMYTNIKDTYLSVT